MTTVSPIVLFSSLSAKISLYEKVLQSARRFDGQARVIGVDCDPNCPAASRVKEFALVPPLEEMDLDSLTNYCLRLGVNHVIPTRDEELTYWSAKRNHLERNGINVMVSDENAIKTCQDKLLFSRSLESSALPPIATSVKLSELQCNYFAVKERSGSASKSIGLNLVAEEATEHAKKLDRPIFQPMMQGREFSAETWINSSGKCQGILLRWRTKIIDGEANESEAFENREWEKSMQCAFEAIPGLSGHALAQVIVDSEQNLHLIEINPRLGGASPLALAAGLNSIEWFLLQAAKREAEIPATPALNKKLKLNKVNGEAIIS
jgi:carbamoyl-phosphate synthase large subunit